jgi:hypothetical protein
LCSQCELTDAPSEEDFTFSTEARRRGEDILTEKKVMFYLQVFGGVDHGFATKGDISVKHIRTGFTLIGCDTAKYCFSSSCERRIGSKHHQLVHSMERGCFGGQGVTNV